MSTTTLAVQQAKDLVAPRRTTRGSIGPVIVHRCSAAGLPAPVVRYMAAPPEDESTVPTVKVRCLVISDTLGQALPKPVPAVDVVFHCGNLTDGSTLAQMAQAIELLRSINAPLKVVIPGRNDWSLDPVVYPSYQRELCGSASDPSYGGMLQTFLATFGTTGSAVALFKAARGDNIILLHKQGNHVLELPDNSLIRVSTSPFTPSDDASAFEFQPEDGHTFDILNRADIVVTHGAPRGILDGSGEDGPVGCALLMAAVARAMPRLHCFGQQASSWGTTRVSWQAGGGQKHLLGTTQTEDSEEGARRIAAAAAQSEADAAKGYREIFIPRDDSQADTVFLNAAMRDDSGNADGRVPWVVTLELPQRRLLE